MMVRVTAVFEACRQVNGIEDGHRHMYGTLSALLGAYNLVEEQRTKADLYTPRSTVS